MTSEPDNQSPQQLADAAILAAMEGGLGAVDGKVIVGLSMRQLRLNVRAAIANTDAPFNLHSLLASAVEVIEAHEEWESQVAAARARGFEFDDPLSDAVEKLRAAIGALQPVKDSRL